MMLSAGKGNDFSGGDFPIIEIVEFSGVLTPGSSISIYVSYPCGVLRVILDRIAGGSWAIVKTESADEDSRPLVGMKLPGELDELRVLVELSVASGTILPGLCAIVTASPFRAAILALVSLIPQGKCASYGQIASALQRFGAARAVGYAMRTNPIAPFVPCHRVVGGSGEMTGYQGKSGIPRKIAYLAGEGVPLIQTGSSGTGVSREAFISADELHGYARLSGALDIADISSIGQHESDGHANRFFLHSRWRRRIDS